MKTLIIGFAGVVIGTSAGVWAGEPTPFIAGSAPDKRPDAPVIQTVDRPNDWLQQAMQGVVGPYPASLDFLKNQGNWYTPFTHPGMTGPYDLRGWHRHAKP